jgi:hypothetical protein
MWTYGGASGTIQMHSAKSDTAGIRSVCGTVTGTVIVILTNLITVSCRQVRFCVEKGVSYQCVL